MKEGKQDYTLHAAMAVYSCLIEKGDEKGFKERL